MSNLSVNDLQMKWLEENTLAFPGLVKYDASDTQPDYIGMNTNPSADDAGTDWVIFKFTYDGTAITQIVRRIGSWTGRTALFA